jgi:uncharacterized protein YqeY
LPGKTFDAPECINIISGPEAPVSGGCLRRPDTVEATDQSCAIMSLKSRIQDDVKSAMRARDQKQLTALRLITAAIKQIEVDKRIELEDDDVLLVLDKMVKQRRDSLAQYEAAGRADLAAQEEFELELLSAYLPEALSEEAINALIQQAIAETGASSIRDMGAVMNILRGQVQGRADMKAVSSAVKAQLGA